VLVRLVLIYAFLMFTSPIATHALARAALATGVEPWTVAEGDEE
jgi:multicomponent Na+:H+ antiporter subunit G